MTQQIINLGLIPNDGSGDALRVGAQKINENFTELYDRGIPEQAGNNGKVLTTSGTVLRWDRVSDVTGNAATVTNGVYTTGSYDNPSWITGLAPSKVLPSQSGNNGKYLTTDGSLLSWVDLEAVSVFDYNNLINRPIFPDNTSDLVNDSGFITSSALIGYATEAYVNSRVSVNKLVNGANELVLGADGALTFPDNLKIAGSIISRRLEQVTEGQVDAIGAKLTLTDNSIAMEAYIDPAGSNNIQYSRITAGTNGVVSKFSVDDVSGETYSQLTVSTSLEFQSTDGVVTTGFGFGGGGGLFVVDGTTTTISNSGINVDGGYNLAKPQGLTVAAATTSLVYSTMVGSPRVLKLILKANLGNDYQACEMMVVRNDSGSIINDTVYAVIHTTVAPFVTYDSQWNAVSGQMEITATNLDLTSSVYVESVVIEVLNWD